MLSVRIFMTALFGFALVQANTVSYFLKVFQHLNQDEVKVVEGSPCQIICKVQIPQKKGFEYIQFSWYKDDKMLQYERYKAKMLEQPEVETIFSIGKVDKTDAGNYTCVSSFASEVQSEEQPKMFGSKKISTLVHVIPKRAKGT